MINNGRREISTSFVRAIILVFICPTIQAELYPYGARNGDVEITFSECCLESQRIDLTTSMPFFGQGKLSYIWLNSVGALTYRPLTTDTPPVNSIIDNIVIAPYYVRPDAGVIYYRQTTTETALFELIEDDFETALILPPNENDIDTIFDFKPTYALVVTWTNVTSTRNQDQTNSFQVAIVTDGVHSFAIYNYDDLQWTSSQTSIHAAAGLFISSNSESSCSYELENSRTPQVSGLPVAMANSGEYGRFILIISEPIVCAGNFQSACAGDLPSSDWGTTKPLFAIGRESWETYVVHTCNAGFEMKPGVTKERIDCVYEADYYDSTWEHESSKCLDLNATKKFVVDVGITKLGNDSFVPPGNLTEDQEDELKKDIEDAISSIMNLTDIIITVTDITFVNDTDLIRRTGDGSVLKANVTIQIPPYIHKKINEETITDIITEVITENEVISGITFHPIVDVTDETDQCLQGCMCRFKRPKPKTCPKGKNPLIKPDSCCGGCDGRPYSSAVKACCGVQVYDPLKSHCCDGKVKKGATGKCP